MAAQVKTVPSLALLLSLSKKLNVLYVEDNDEVREQTLKMLRNYFTNITVATNGQDGLREFEENYFHIIFTDLKMPVMDGMSMIDKIREIDTFTPIIVLTAHSNTEFFLQTINAGIDGYILKPYDFNQINDTIEKIILRYDVEVKPKSEIYLEYGYVWDKIADRLVKDGKIVKLTKNEIRLFKAFLEALNNSLNGEQIENIVFNANPGNNKRVRNLISRLNLKLGDRLIESHYGVGYSLKMRDIKK
jgi:DNA-binding response OmpR family regulator